MRRASRWNLHLHGAPLFSTDEAQNAREHEESQIVVNNRKTVAPVEVEANCEHIKVNAKTIQMGLEGPRRVLTSFAPTGLADEGTSEVLAPTRTGRLAAARSSLSSFKTRDRSAIIKASRPCKGGSKFHGRYKNANRTIRTHLDDDGQVLLSSLSASTVSLSRARRRNLKPSTTSLPASARDCFKDIRSSYDTPRRV